MAQAPYRIPASRVEVEEVIRRSRFLTYLGHADEVEQARRFIDAIRELYPDATHHCWAYNLGPPGDTARIAMSDDGEPRGTAGRPMLNALLHSDVGEVVAVCVRYYGGTKLGTGGLARAYGGGVREALDRVSTSLKKEVVAVTIATDYPHSDAVERILACEQVRIEDRAYGEQIRFHCEVDADFLSRLTEALADATRGSARIDVGPVAP